MYIHIHTYTGICTYSVFSHRSANEPPSRPVISTQCRYDPRLRRYRVGGSKQVPTNDPHRVVLQDGRGCKITQCYSIILETPKTTCRVIQLFNV